jgi:hypothetical protein
MHIEFIYEPSADKAPPGFKDAIRRAADIIGANILTQKSLCRDTGHTKNTSKCLHIPCGLSPKIPTSE